jgi:hypothetical protein
MSITPKQTVDFDSEAFVNEEGFVQTTKGEMIQEGIKLLVQHCHAASYNRGWWHDPITGFSLIPGELNLIDPFAKMDMEMIIKAWFPYVIATKIALIHSEVSEGLEAFRTDEMDDKIPFMGITAEMGDAVIRIADLMACLQEQAKLQFAGNSDYDLGAAILAKIPYNSTRKDHDFAGRKKKF